MNSPGIPTGTLSPKPPAPRRAIPDEDESTQTAPLESPPNQRPPGEERPQPTTTSEEQE